MYVIAKLFLNLFIIKKKKIRSNNNNKFKIIPIY